MRLKKALEEKELDVRVRDRLVAEGKLKKEDLKSFIGNLKDEAANATFIESEATQKLQ